MKLYESWMNREKSVDFPHDASYRMLLPVMG